MHSGTVEFHFPFDMQSNDELPDMMYPKLHWKRTKSPKFCCNLLDKSWPFSGASRSGQRTGTQDLLIWYVSPSSAPVSDFSMANPAVPLAV